MKHNEKKILIVAVCCIAIIGLTAYFFTEPSTAARKGNGQGRAFASQCNPGQQGDGWNRQNANCPGDCSDETENCSGDCDNCDEDSKNFKNRPPVNEAQTSEVPFQNRTLEENTEGKNRNQDDPARSTARSTESEVKNQGQQEHEQPDKSGSGQGIWMYSQETQSKGSQQGSGQGQGSDQGSGRQGRGCSEGCCP
jgi:hypothetical protein